MSHDLIAREQAAQTPLVELLESVPADARLWYEHSPTHHSLIPVGRYCNEAATRLREMEAEIAALREAVNGLNKHIETMQDRARSYLEPGVYVDRAGGELTDSYQADGFIDDMIYLLDGPEQREAQSRARNALEGRRP